MTSGRGVTVHKQVEGSGANATTWEAAARPSVLPRAATAPSLPSTSTTAAPRPRSQTTGSSNSTFSTLRVHLALSPPLPPTLREDAPTVRPTREGTNECLLSIIGLRGWIYAQQLNSRGHGLTGLLPPVGGRGTGWLRRGCGRYCFRTRTSRSGRAPGCRAYGIDTGASIISVYARVSRVRLRPCFLHP